MTRFPTTLVRVTLVCLATLSVTGCSWFRRGESTDRAAVPAPAPPTARAAELQPGDADVPTGPVRVLHINEDAITVEEVVGPIRADLIALADSASPERYSETVIAALRDRIRAMARDVLLYQEASRRLTDRDTDFLERFTDQRIREIVQKEHNGRQVRWEEAMAARGITAEEARDRVRRELTVIRYLQQTIAPRVEEPTRRDLMRYFEQKKAEMTTPETREMYLIEVLKGDSPAQGRAKIEQALAELRGGADFESVAAKYSEGLHAEDGGHWGIIDPASIRGRWAQAAKVLVTLAPGQNSGIVEADESFFIVRLGHYEPAQEPTFAEVQVQLKEAYHDHQFSMLVDELVTRLQDRATIRPENLNLFLEAAVGAVHGP